MIGSIPVEVKESILKISLCLKVLPYFLNLSETPLVAMGKIYIFISKIRQQPKFLNNEIF